MHYLVSITSLTTRRCCFLVTHSSLMLSLRCLQIDLSTDSHAKHIIDDILIILAHYLLAHSSLTIWLPCVLAEGLLGSSMDLLVVGSPFYVEQYGQINWGLCVFLWYMPKVQTNQPLSLWSTSTYIDFFKTLGYGFCDASTSSMGLYRHSCGCGPLLYRHPLSTITSSLHSSRIAPFFFWEIVGKFHDMHKSVISNCNLIFQRIFWKELFQLHGTKLHFSFAYHPKINGPT